MIAGVIKMGLIVNGRRCVGGTIVKVFDTRKERVVKAVLAGLILDSTHHIDAAKEGRGHVVVL